MSVYGTGNPTSSFSGFSWHRGSSDLVRRLLRPSEYMQGRFADPCLLELSTGITISRSLYLMRPHITPLVWCWNLNQLSIGCAFRPHLRSRLTLGGRPFPRKPCSFGGGDSHSSYRYSYRQSHFPYLQQSFRSAFNGLGNAPLPLGLPRKTKFAASVHGLAPIIFGARSLD